MLATSDPELAKRVPALKLECLVGNGGARRSTDGSPGGRIDSPSYNRSRTLGAFVDQRSAGTDSPGARGDHRPGTPLANASFCVGEDRLYRLGAHDGLVLPPVHLRVGRWVLYSTLCEGSDPTGDRATERAAGVDGMKWGLVGVCLDCEGWRGYRLREGIPRQSGEEGSRGQFYGLIRESDWVNYLGLAGDRDWRQPGEAARAFAALDPPSSRGTFLYCAPTARPMHVLLWTADRIAGADATGLLNPVTAFLIMNDNWHGS